MADSNLKRLYGEDAPSGFAGNILDATNFNSILAELLMTSSQTGTYSGDNIDFGNGISATVLTKNAAGDPLTIQLQARIPCSKTPFYPDATNKNYTNPDIKLVDGASSYAVYRETGSQVPNSSFTLTGTGVIQFGTAQTNKYFW
jgi:hypothetical protein